MTYMQKENLIRAIEVIIQECYSIESLIALLVTYIEREIVNNESGFESIKTPICLN